MNIQLVTPRKSLNKAFLKQKPLRSEIELFKANLIRLLDKVDEIEREENQKNHIRDFLRDTFYKETKEINTKDTKDLVIHLGKTNKDKVGVIIEAKRPGNKTEMLSPAKPNSKALQELVLYYLRERIEENNIDIKYLIATNVYEWYIFEAATFEKLFYRNKSFVKQYEQWRDGQKVTSDTNLFYNDIAKPFIDSLTDEITCTHFDIRNYETILRNANKEDDKSLIALQKLLSPNHLLKVPFTNDSNSLNEKFYKELLHIIGLEEVKEGSKNIIRRKITYRHSGSLLENAINILETDDTLRRIRDKAAYGEKRDDQLFNIALELCLTWINRVLFLKLLEGQLITYHKGDPEYRFLNSDMITDYDELYKLFHQVLARDVSERTAHIQEKYSRVPYLNSSLFEISDLEAAALKINSLDNSETLELISTTILKDERKKNTSLPTLHYLFKFLDAYDFASEGGEDIAEDNKTIINASVLGKVFEKINGYKDGSIFTPGFITMYMSRQSLRPAVIQKFNEHFKTTGIAEAATFEELYNRVDKVEIKAANNIVNSLRVCDPAVGSGHFLVSALNELILIKSELGILADKHGKRLRDYEFTIENDELIITDEHGLFVYNHLNRESQRVQETIFGERQTIIENCLFGVDINPNSVKICRLRLWIELLKSSYYLPSPSGEGPGVRLETLPNIDINIKCGNSLISRYALDADIKKALKRSKWNIKDYQIAVMNYRNAHSKGEKRAMEDLIATIKTDFETEVSTSDKRFIRLKKAKDDLFNLTNQGQLFEKSKKEVAEWNKKVAALSLVITKLEQEIEEIKNNAIYKNAFEWRFEFPEVLNDEGDFVGFDVVIANPPYIRQEELSNIKNYLFENYKVFSSGGDIFSYFYELSSRILKKSGILAFINNTFDKTTAGKVLREFLVKNFKFQRYIDFTGVVVFEEATTYPIILIAEKSSKFENLKYFKFTKEIYSNKDILYDEKVFEDIHQITLNPSAWNFLKTSEHTLIKKIRNHKALSEIYGKSYRGIITGLNEAFVTEKNLGYYPQLKSVYDGKDLKKWISPPSFKKMIVFESKSTKLRFGNLSERDALANMQTDFPEIINYLLPFAEAAKKRFDKGEYWWELRNCAYYELFQNPKIIFPNLQNTNKFAFDVDGIFLNAPAVFLPTDDKCLLALLNSKVVWHFLKNICVIRSGGFIEVKPQYFEQIPIPGIPADEKQPFIQLVDQILEAKKQGQDTTALEQQVDELVYGLYGITEEERRVIEG